MRNYLLVLLRTLQREKLYAAINIAGLSLGVACCLLLGLFLWSELTYDRHFNNYQNIYRVVNEFSVAGSHDRFAVTSRALAPMVAAENPEVKAWVRFQNNGAGSGDSGGLAIHHGNDVYFWNNTYFASDNVFDVFSHKILYGNPKTALKDPGAIAISETVAKRYFGNANPIGETLTTDSGLPNKITLVFADLPPNTHLKYDMLFSDNGAFMKDPDSQTARRNQLWNVGNFTYLAMAPGFNPKDWPRFSDEFYKRNMTDIGKQLSGSWKSWVQPLASIHLNSDVGYDLPTGNPIYLYGCAAVALFILVVACINYMNLATARAMRRAHSVGIRKILGASRLTLGLQFLGEAVVFSLLAVLIGVVIVEVVLRFTSINSLMGQQVSLDLGQHPALIGVLVGLGVLMGLLSGIYPAFYLSSWAPLSALASKNAAGKGNLRLREALVLVQFTISVAVIASTILMAAQMHYIASKSLGFQKENQVIVTLRGASTIEKVNTIRTELAKNAHILGSTEARAVMGQATGMNVIDMENNSGVMTHITTANLPIGDDFVSVMGLKIVQGRDFSKRLLTDVGLNCLVNEATVRKMGWTEPLGKRVQAGGGALTGRVVGVLADFNYKSLHSKVEPLLLFPQPDDFTGMADIMRPFQERELVVKISGTDVDQTLGYIEDVMAKVDPKHPFEFAFLDDQLNHLYKSEHQLTRLIGIFATVCIFIACLGLFGLASFTTEQRTREIGTRKVLGASAWQIITLLSRRMLLLVVVASVFAAVISYFAIDEWLTGFAYRAGINPLIFLLAAAVAVVVAFVTVALQSYKTASADPVDALRQV
jgi:putative ABC transport system permease protein